MANIIFIDNFLVNEFRVIGNHVEVFRNNLYPEVLLDKINSLENPIVLISPGPGNPANAGCIVDLVSILKYKVPIIGICFGHQAIL